MNRRELLAKSATTAVGIGMLPGLAVLFESCGISRERLSDYEPSYLSPMQFDTVWLLAETILPKTDTPGASDAGVAPFVDLLFTSFYTENELVRQKVALNSFITGTKDHLGKHFLDLDPSKRTTYLTELDESDDEFFKTFKRLALWAFFTSEPGRKSMNYLPIPGRYEATAIDESEKLLIGN